VDEASILASKDPRFKGTDADVKTIFSHVFLKTSVADAKLVENAEVEATVRGMRLHVMWCVSHVSYHCRRVF
jgi:hypothetical protein